MDKGCLVISLDFELLWGGLDCWTVDGYGKSNVAQVGEAIKKMIALFEQYGVHATFATVGFLMLNDTEEIRSNKPLDIPTYTNSALNPYSETALNQALQHLELYFAPKIVERMKAIPGMEVGTHSFCHFYCWEEGQTVEQFEADMTAACDVARQKGILLESIVFPRNQVSKAHLEVCARHGVKTYRGNARKYFDHTTSRWKEFYNKVSRLLDAYMNWGGNTTIPYSSIDLTEQPMNIPASRMLRPYMQKLKLLEPLRLRRIKREMKYAAKHHELYHLWWHPHNFGADMDENMAFLEEVLKCYQTCHQQYGMQSLTMNELYYKLTKDK